MSGDGLTVGSLFSGIGGLELGLAICGIGPVLWQCDSDPYARAVLEHHWPEVHRYNDVREIDGSAARVDLVCGGFPCQDVSDAGHRVGIGGERSGLWTEFARVIGERSGLWTEFARVIGELRPSFVFIENVPGLRTRGLRRVLADLAALGFDADWDHFSAAETGAPHTRERVFILAHANAQPGEARLGRAGFDDWAGPVLGARDPERPGVWLAPSPEACRGTDGHAGRMDVALLGNACVPQQAALAFKTLMARITPEDHP